MKNPPNSGAQSLSFVSDESDAGARLDAFLSSKIEAWSRSRLQRLIEDEDVLVNGRPAKTSYKLKPGDEIDIDLVEAPSVSFQPENIPLDIVFEDEYIAVINKPAGMVVHPGAGNESGTLANAIAWYFMSDRAASAGSTNTGIHDLADNDEAAPAASLPGLGSFASSVPPAHSGGSDRVGIVHRLDKDTSGLIVVAKNEQTAEQLSRQFHDREVEKTYVALVHGHIEQNSGTIDRPIARDRWHRTKMTVAANGRHALTLWKVRQRFEKFTLLEVDIKTGRTHQIRVHLASINHPVVGDATYNDGRDNSIANIEIKKAAANLNRFFLHAERLSFSHPVTRKIMSFQQDLPKELIAFVDLL